MWEFIEKWLRPHQEGFELEVVHMVLRSAVVFVAAIAMVRIGHKRFMGRSTTFDLILGIMLGSVLSRAITGQSPFFPTLAGGLVLILMHALLSWIAYRFRWFGPLVKGCERLLVKDGKVIEAGMRRSLVGRNDLMEALRSHACVTSLDEVELAHLERSGNISVILKKRPPRVVDVKVEEGVQTVRIEIG